MDFQGPNHQMRVVSLHPGVTLEQVRDNTGFDLAVSDSIDVTSAPTVQQLEIIADLDPLNVRSKQIKGNPPGDPR